MSVAIVTDSTACLHPDDAEREGIAVVPLKVVIGEETFTEGCGLTGDEIAKALKAKKPVSTSRPTPEEFLEVYESLAADGAEEIVSIHLSAEGVGDAGRRHGRRQTVADTGDGRRLDPDRTRSGIRGRSSSTRPRCRRSGIVHGSGRPLGR